jgi:pyruvate kinase
MEYWSVGVLRFQPGTPFHQSFDFVDSPTLSCTLVEMRRTKIVCTIGPTSSSDKVLEGLIRAGMNVARLNFSHGDYASHRRVIRKIRQFERKLDQPVAVLQDLPGPKIRIGAVAGDRVRLQNRRPFVLTTQKILGSELAVSVNFSGLTEAVNKGDPILLGDGEIELETVEVGNREVKCRIVVGGILGSHKGIHFPKSSLNIRALTRHDKQDMASASHRM